ncbi:dTMP kinase [Streptomyces sp. NBC_00986]|uniref:dTMP kinase n=1 Tax=Streptomyces sp. NBC_00986 TaxID=2903702 RepID=UPI003864718D|nr:dTMP kinase [Streptomyces sp. NBC_00986]
MTANDQGLFVTIDGPGGVGKSTALEHTRARLTRHGLRVHSTREPSGTSLGELARHGTETYRGLSLACLVAADRYHHIETEIQPAVERGEIVLCDRYIASSLVLQRLDDVPVETVWALNSHARRPDLSVILTAEPGVIAQRLRARGAHSRFEKMPDGSKKETTLFAEAATFLQEAGFATLVVDCTSRTPAETADIIAAEITRPSARNEHAN